VWDELGEAWLSNHVANRASRLQGRAFWTAAARGFAFTEEAAPSPGHLAPVMGLVAARLGIGRMDAARLHTFHHLRGLVSAAVRLGVVGPLEGQRIQHGCASLAESVAACGISRDPDQLAQTAPLLDIWQGAQDRLYSRLFQS